jgi:hypothetical protein
MGRPAHETHATQFDTRFVSPSRWGPPLFAALLVSLSLAFVGAPAASQGRVHAAPRVSGISLSPTAWKTWWGNASFASNAVTLSSTAPTSPSETHSALITSKKTWSNVTFSVNETTLEQLRVGSAPNPWEVGWLMFRFQNLQNYYYFILKPNGIELGKKQGSDAQIFLVTADTPQLSIGMPYTLKVAVSGPRIQVSVDGLQVIDFTDPHPLSSGSIGLYEEDSQARFASLALG